MAKEGGRYFVDKDGKERKADLNSEEHHIYPPAVPTSVSAPQKPAPDDSASKGKV